MRDMMSHWCLPVHHEKPKYLEEENPGGFEKWFQEIQKSEMSIWGDVLGNREKLSKNYCMLFQM